MNKYLKHIHNLLNHFCNRFLSEYAPFPPGSSTMSSVVDVVNVYEEKQPRQKWLLGQITNLLESGDNVVRRAVAYLGKTKRPVEGTMNKLYPVEFQDEFKLSRIMTI